MISCCDNYSLVFRKGARIVRSDSSIIEDPIIECANCGFLIDTDGLIGDWHNPEQIKWAKELYEEEAEIYVRRVMEDLKDMKERWKILEIDIGGFVQIMNRLRITHAELRSALFLEFENGLLAYLYAEGGDLRADMNWRKSKKKELDEFLESLDALFGEEGEEEHGNNHNRNQKTQRQARDSDNRP